MAVIVTAAEAEEIRFEDANKWVIDENERLHIIGDNGNIASYNRGFWRSVSQAVEA
ncbi:hypothetical protein SEA_ABBYDAISY_42 [Arthrobacter phage AbbyDaisy]|nr:hypothetical protein SEA_ABBYDAISY_42 [Arthrobacter phage AbbyDaisy]